MKRYDAVVIGAGPAGLTAATYLGRFRRSTLVLDGGPSRASWIPETHNTPGFSRGVSGPHLLTLLRDQAEQYGADIRKGRVEGIEKEETGFRLKVAGGVIEAPFVLLATGVLDNKPPLAGIDEAIRSSLVRICPICDAYEAIDKRIAILGDSDLGGREALFLRHYSTDVTLLHIGGQALTEARALKAADVTVIQSRPEAIVLGQAEVTVAGRVFDHLYLALGCKPQSRLVRPLAAAHDADGNLVVDAHQQTSVDGLYAAGDVVRGLNQIAIAAAEAALAATAIHNRLRA
jgi:thioredoxin reductase (NADPH)